MSQSRLTIEQEHALTEAAHSKLTAFLQSFGNKLSHDHSEAVRAMLHSMTQMANGTLSGRYSFGLNTGTGKTSAVLCWCAAMIEQAHDFSVAVSAFRVKALVKLFQDMRDQMQIPAAKLGILHSREDEADEQSTPDNDERQILLVTHKRIRGGDLNQFNYYHGQRRNLCIYDESLITTESQFLPMFKLVKVLGGVTATRRTDPRYSDFLRYAHECEKLIQAEVQRLKESGHDEGLLTLPAQSHETVTAFRTLIDEGEDDDSASKPLHTLLELANIPLRVIPAGDLGLVSYKVSVPDEVENVLVLDASTPLRQLVRLDKSIKDAQDHVPAVRVLKTPLAEIKSYENVELHQMYSGGGRRTMKDDFRKPVGEQKTIKEIAEVIKTLPENEAVLIFTYKGNVTGGMHYTEVIRQGLRRKGINLKAMVKVVDHNGKTTSKPRFMWQTFGMETGSNDFSYATNVVLAGVMQRNPTEMAGAYLGQLRNIAAPIPQGKVMDLVESEVAHVAFQALSRGSCRIMVDGKAKAMKGWLIHKDANLRSRLNEVMHGVVWKEWTQQFKEVKEGKVEVVAKQIRDYLERQLESVDTCSTRKIKANLQLENVSKDSFTRAIELVVQGSCGWMRSERGLVRASAVFGKTA